MRTLLGSMRGTGRTPNNRGGGYVNGYQAPPDGSDGGFFDALSVNASFPTDARTWFVRVANGTGVTVELRPYAICATAR